MSLDIETIKQVAKLAKLELTEAESTQFQRQVGAVLEHFKHLETLDTKDVEPLAHVGDLTNSLRDDVAAGSLPREAALQNAPSSDGEHFLVPPVFKGIDAES